MLVTARHVAQKLHTPFVVRMNRQGNSAGLVHIEQPSDITWRFHPNEAVDIAVAAFDIPAWASVGAYVTDDLVNKDPERWQFIRVGDEVSVIGLFHLHYGGQVNQPIAHTGHVAMFPKEPLRADGKMQNVFLVEANAISGCSGSPVWAVGYVGVELGDNEFMAQANQVTLLGVWSSSWKVKASEITVVRTHDDDDRGTLAPLGMGMVTHASFLREIIMGNEMKGDIEEARNRRTR